MKEIFESKGVDTDKPMAFSCGTGITAAWNLECAESAGLSGTKYLYDGSWSEYIDKKTKEQ